MQAVKGLGSNPWKHDAKAASRGQCPVCQIGLPGCPYCFEMPVHPSGEKSTPEEYEYDVRRALREQAERERKEALKAARAALKRRRMIKMLELKDRR